jgi:hypothetical protein
VTEREWDGCDDPRKLKGGGEMGESVRREETWQQVALEAFLGLCLLACGAGGAFLSWQWHRAQQSRLEAQKAYEEARKAAEEAQRQRENLGR